MSDDEFPGRDVCRLALRWWPTVSINNPHLIVDSAAHYSELSPKLSLLPGTSEPMLDTLSLTLSSTRRFLSYAIGWVIFFGEIATSAGCAMNNAQIIGSLIQLSHPEFELTVSLSDCCSSSGDNDENTEIQDVAALHRNPDPRWPFFLVPKTSTVDCRHRRFHNFWRRHSVGGNLLGTVAEADRQLRLHAIHEPVWIHKHWLGRDNELLYPGLRPLWHRRHPSHSRRD